MKWFKQHKIDIFDIIYAFLILSFLIGFDWAMNYSFYKSYNNAKEIGTEPEIKVMKEVEYIEKIRYANELEQIEHNRDEVEMIAKTVWGEYRDPDKTKQAAVVWCILNRVDNEGYPNNITDVITQPNQFTGYRESNPVDDEIVWLVEDVMTRWAFEKTAIGNVGRVLPKEYMWFRGNSQDNWFRDSYAGDYHIWDWSLQSPYD